MGESVVKLASVVIAACLVLIVWGQNSQLKELQSTVVNHAEQMNALSRQINVLDLELKAQNTKTLELYDQIDLAMFEMSRRVQQVELGQASL